MEAQTAQARVALPRRIDGEALRGLDRAARVVMLQGSTMGTLWRVRAVWPLDDPVALRAAVVARLDDLVEQLSHWLPSSALCRFNAMPGGAWARLPADLAHVIAAGLDVFRESQGAFSPAMGRLVDLWGFGPPGPMPDRPDASAVEELRPFCDASRLAWEKATGRLRQPGGLSLDLSGIAKGYAVDALAHLLREMGVRHGLVEVGGELTGWGVQPDGQPWWVDLESPAGARIPPLRIALHGLAVATSGTYIRGDHNLNPATGYPANSGVLACSVIHSSAMMADAWASAFIVTGAEKGLVMARTHGLAARWLMADGGEVMSDTLCDMIAN